MRMENWKLLAGFEIVEKIVISYFASFKKFWLQLCNAFSSNHKILEI